MADGGGRVRVGWLILAVPGAGISVVGAVLYGLWRTDSPLHCCTNSPLEECEGRPLVIGDHDHAPVRGIERRHLHAPTKALDRAQYGLAVLHAEVNEEAGRHLGREDVHEIGAAEVRGGIGPEEGIVEQGARLDIGQLGVDPARDALTVRSGPCRIFGQGGQGHRGGGVAAAEGEFTGVAVASYQQVRGSGLLIVGDVGEHAAFLVGGPVSPQVQGTVDQCLPAHRGVTDDYDCERFHSEVKSSREINLPPEKVTDDVAGCHPGNQPSVNKRISYSKASTVSVSASLKFDLKILTGAAGVFKQIKGFGPGIGVGVSYSWSTTFGSSEGYTIPADYGKVPWGTFSQRATESVVDETVVIRNTGIGHNDSYLYTVYGITVVTPIEEDTTKFPQGTLAKDSRDFKSVEEFKQLCPTGVLPEYLGGKPDPGVPDPNVARLAQDRLRSRSRVEGSHSR